VRRWAALPSTLAFLWRHPIAARGRARALARFVWWQLWRREVAVPFVGSTRLWLAPGRTAATANWYVGLAELAEMGFALHLLEAGDLFVDVGANVGAYTLLAAGVRGALCLALEPSDDTFALLLRNLALNRIEPLVDAKEVAAAEAPGKILLSVGLDAIDHVVAAGEATPSRTVSAAPLDQLLDGRAPTLIKIDVEGFEERVLAGAANALASPSLLAVIVELNGQSRRYGVESAQSDARLRAHGFAPHRYLPFARRLVALDGPDRESGNTIYVRARAEVERRLMRAPRLRIHGVEL
jgi:FkbM family methyltransferase